MSKEKQYYRGLDVLRGICAVLIVLYHYTARYNESPYTTEELQTNWPFSLTWGSMAVVTFFLLSGFLSGVYEQEQHSPIFQYVKKRVIRLYPAFLVGLALTSLITFFFYKEAFVGFKDILLNLTMLPGLLGAKPVDGVYWTLQYEIIFYAFTVFLLFIPKLKWKKGIFCVWILGAIAFRFFGWEIDGFIFSAVRLFLIPNYMQTFVLGICIKEISLKKGNWATYALIVLCFVNHFLYLGWKSSLFLLISALFVLYVTAINEKSILNRDNKFTKFFGWLAGISYALYLVHQNIGYAMIRIFVANGLTNQVFVLIPIAVSVLLAWLIHRFVEEPIGKCLKKKLKERERSNG